MTLCCFVSYWYLLAGPRAPFISLYFKSKNNPIEVRYEPSGIRYHGGTRYHTRRSMTWYLVGSCQLELLGTCWYLIQCLCCHSHRPPHTTGPVAGSGSRRVGERREVIVARWCVLKCHKRSPTGSGLTVGWFYLEIECYRRMVAVCV